MLSVLKNDYCRMLKRLPAVLIMTAVMLVSIVLAVYVTSAQQVKGHVALISQTNIAPASSKYLSVTVMKQEPPYSALVKHQYDAYVIDKGNGEYEIKTLKNDQLKTMIKSLLQNPNAAIPAQETDRGVGVNIVGFLMMFLLMETFMNLFTFADDKEQGQLARIVLSPVSLVGYLAAHCIYCLSMFLPSYLMLVVIKAASFDIGFSLLQYALLLFLISILGISFALLLNTFFSKPDNAAMLGNSILVITSVLAGSFYSFSKDNRVLDWIIRILPQKQLLNLAQYMQNSNLFAQLLPLCYVLVVSIVFFAISWYKLKRQFIKIV